MKKTYVACHAVAGKFKDNCCVIAYLLMLYF